VPNQIAKSNEAVGEYNVSQIEDIEYKVIGHGENVNEHVLLFDRREEQFKKKRDR